MAILIYFKLQRANINFVRMFGFSTERTLISVENRQPNFLLKINNVLLYCVRSTLLWDVVPRLGYSSNQTDLSGALKGEVKYLA